MTSADDPANQREADIVIACDDFAAALDAYTGELDFRLDLIFPADSPRMAVLSGHGIRVRLEGSVPVAGSTASDFVLTRNTDDSWGTGRAGMQYRDLIPDRFGGRLIASHIRIPVGGPVPDYVHHHHVRFQMIYCYRGWVKVVYQDQGEPFVMRSGDCVLQPPHIRHRVLESSDNMEVIEVAGPSEHETLIDHDLQLPMPATNPDRDFGGQRFVRHQADAAEWLPAKFPGFESRDTGIARATDGIAEVVVIRPSTRDAHASIGSDDALTFVAVLAGNASLARPGGQRHAVAVGDVFALSEGVSAELRDVSDNLELLCVQLS